MSEVLKAGGSSCAIIPHLAFTGAAQRAFTLVELLVVITIIGILICAAVAGGTGGEGSGAAISVQQQS